MSVLRKICCVARRDLGRNLDILKEVEIQKDIVQVLQIDTQFDYHISQDSIAVAKKTAQCAQYMGALKSFESPHYAPGYFSRNL